MNLKGRMFQAFLFVFLITSLFLAEPPICAGQTAEERINAGETALFSDTVEGILEAHAIFEAARTAFPSNAVINAYLAITRLFDLALREDGTGLTDLFAEYGILRSGTDLDALEFQPTLRDDQYLIIPESAPSGETPRSFMAGTVLNALTASILNLNTTIIYWSDTSKRIVSSAKTGNSLDLEWDYGDVCLFRAALKMAKAFVLTATAYDLNVDISEVIALANLDALHMGKLLDRYQNSLKLLSVTSTPSVNGAAQLAEARTTLISAIDDYLLASDKIRNDPGTNSGAEELIAIEECDLLEEELLRQRLEGLRDSLQDGTVFEFIEREEAWLFTNGAGKRLQVELIDNMSEGQFWGLDGAEFISGNGGIECVFIDGGWITLRLVSSGWFWADVTFTGTLNAERTQITGGTYSGWNWQGNVSGSFTAMQTGVEDEVIALNLNPLFGNGIAPNGGPYDARDFLPDFDCIGDPIQGTMGHALGNDATLGGIFPDFTQDDWGLDGPPASCEPPDPHSSITVNLTVPDYDGTGLIIIAVFRDDGGYNTLEENRVGDLVFLYPGEYTPGMSMPLVIDGLPAGETVWVTVRWDADYTGIRTRGDYSKSAGPVTIAADGSSVVNLNANSMYVGDQESPYFRQCVVMNFTSPSGIQTAVQAEVYDPNGTVPDTISSLRVTYPDGTTTYDFVLSDYAGSNVYYHGISGQQPPVGEYTFTVTDTEGRTATSFFHFGGGPDLPYVDLATLQASGDASGATLSWGGVAGYQGNVFYRARVFGQAGNTIWTSGLGPGTSVSIPGHILQQIGADPEPKWRVEAFDNHTYYVSYHRSVTERKRLLPADNSSPYFDFATVFHRKDSGGDWTQVEVSVIDPDGNVPSSIQTLEVYDSSNNLICSLDHTDPVRQFTWDGAFSVFYTVFPGSPTAGVYRFVVRDDQENEKTTYDYVGPFFEIPVVDHSTYQAWGEPLTPILSWAAPADMNRPIYYRIIIEDGTGARAWGSDRITDTSIQVPAGRLQPGPGVSYTWYVRTNENKVYGHYNNQGRAERATLSVNPSPKPYFRWAGVHRRHDADGSFTGLSAGVIDPAAALPGSLTSLSVLSPRGDTYVLVNNGSLATGVSYDSYYGEFFLRATGSFQPGLYTYTLVKGDFTLVSHDWVGDTPEMPLVEAMSITVSGNPAAPTVSWSGVSGFQGNVYYRLRVQDTAGNQIYSTSRDPVTAQTIPMGRLEVGKIYLARVEAQEHPDWVTYNSRSTTAYAWFSTEGGTMTGVSGRVMDDFGSPIPNLHVYAQAESCWGPWQAGTMTNQNGEYTLYMPAGTYVIRACATCTGLGFVDEWYNNVYNCGEASPVFLGTNQMVQGIDFVLNTAAHVSGYVFEEDGLTPIPNLHVYAQTYDTQIWVAGTMTDGTGFYRLNVPAGTYIVNACASCTGLPYVDAWYDDPGTPEYPEPVLLANPGDTAAVDFSLALQPLPGDMNGDRVVNLADAIVGLQLVVGLSPADVNYGADVNGDGKLGLEEVLYILQYLAGLRP